MLKLFAKSALPKNACRFLSNHPIAVVGNSKIKSLINKHSHLELTVQGADNFENIIDFNPHWLRFNCKLSKDKDSGQRTINSASIPYNLTIDSLKIDDQDLVIEWNKESEQADSRLALSFLVNYHSSETPGNQERFKPCREVAYFDYSKFHDLSGEKNQTELLKWYEHMANYGMAVLKNVGTKENQVRKVAELISPVSKTIYGEEFDVRVEKYVTNVALLDGPLPLHMDLPYYEAPPGLQLLHCIRFDDEIKGGESLLLDSFTTLEEFRKEHPVYFDNLVKIPASWQYLIIGHLKQEVMSISKPHISLNHLGQLIGFRWSPDQEGPLQNLNQGAIKTYYESYLTLARFLSNSKNLIEYRVKPGELLVFNNRRFLHGRNGFTSMLGSRHLQGCYVNLDEFISEYRSQRVKSQLGEKKSGSSSFFVDLSDIKMKSIAIGNNDYA